MAQESHESQNPTLKPNSNQSSAQGSQNNTRSDTSSVDTATGAAAPSSVSETRVKSVFSEIATQYEKFNHASSFGRDRAWLLKLVELAPVNSKTRMLDIAGGTGEVTFTMCAHKPPESVLLTDYTPAMLEVAKKRIARGDSNNVPVLTKVVDAQDMSISDNAFDVVTMAYGIRNMPKRMQALKEILRVLRPGGTVVILEFATPKNPLIRFFYNGYLRWGIPAWGNHFTGHRDDFVYLAKSIRAFPDQKHFCGMLCDAGFVHVEYHDLTFGVAALYRAQKPAEGRRR